ncbi:conserved hypothetical protein [Oenococcus oeni]|nr:conserved hypothetical protein [Oenococcus oeni]SYW04114.1 conserved hypothetical protein [Oenococcus oeni]SYW19020.1 conserved hypothetical protein [Oenococcus oeni]
MFKFKKRVRSDIIEDGIAFFIKMIMMNVKLLERESIMNIKKAERKFVSNDEKLNELPVAGCCCCCCFRVTQN